MNNFFGLKINNKVRNNNTMRITPKQIKDNKNKYKLYFSNQKPKYKTYKYFELKPYKSMKITKTNKIIKRRR